MAVPSEVHRVEGAVRAGRGTAPWGLVIADLTGFGAMPRNPAKSSAGCSSQGGTRSERAVPGIRNVDPRSRAGRHIEVGKPQFGVRGCAQVSGQMNVALAPINERLTSDVGSRYAARGLSVIESDLPGLHEHDDRSRMTVPATLPTRGNFLVRLRGARCEAIPQLPTRTRTSTEAET